MIRRVFARPLLKVFLHFVAACTVLLVILTAASHAAHAQVDTSTAKPRAFLDCPACDDAYMRQGLTFVELVRDPRLADVHVIVATSALAMGAELVLIETIDRRRVRRDTSTFTLPPTATEVERRAAVLRGIRFALVPGLLRSSLLQQFELVARDSSSAAPRPSSQPDRWRRWVMRVGVSGDSQRDDNYGQTGIEGSLGAVRVTDAAKVNISYEQSSRTSRFRLSDSSTLRVTQRDQRFAALWVRSLGRHAGVGGQVRVESSVFQNVKARANTRLALEANLFPYEEATRRQALLRYGIGYDALRYRDTTIYGLLRETRPQQTVILRLDTRESWGGAWLKGTWQQYLHDGSKRRTVIDFNIDWRVVTGVNFYIGGSYGLLNDQIALVGANLTDQERLLRIRELRSGASSYTAIGLSFTFGSRFNDVVNLRFPN